jgi:hypothetical protein
MEKKAAGAVEKEAVSKVEAVAKKPKKPAKPLPGFKAIITAGTSASGKSTWARAFEQSEQKEGRSWLVLSRDDLRLDILRESGLAEDDLPARLKAWAYGFGNPMEAKVHGKWLSAIRKSSKTHEGVVFADTNLDGGRSLKSALEKLGFLPGNVSVKLFDIGFDEAIERDAGRRFSVGKEVLARQFSAFARTVALRRMSAEAPLTYAWCMDPSSGFEMPKSLLAKKPKAAKK